MKTMPVSSGFIKIDFNQSRDHHSSFVDSNMRQSYPQQEKLEIGRSNFMRQVQEYEEELETNGVGSISEKVKQSSVSD